jgi:parallel beta-helix repeat protein
MEVTYKVTTLNDNGCGSLRKGIEYGNKNKNVTIIFNINGEIKLESSLPGIINPIKIIGNLSSTGLPLNTINGNKKYKLLKIFNTKNCIIKNLCLINSSNYGIFINQSCSNEIYNCMIGIDTNNKKKSCMYGIVLYKSSKNIIGSNPNAEQDYFSNIISGNCMYGINIIDSKNNIIKNNIIGLSSTCDKEVPNCYGICMMCSEKNEIGGKVFIDSNKNINNPTGNKGTETPTFVRPLEGNIISGNKNDGINLRNSHYNNFFGNFIGTDNTGLINFGNGKNGMYLEKSNFNFISGCGIDSNPFIYYNVVSFNKINGIEIYNSNFTTIQGNFLGIAADNNNYGGNLTGLKISGTSEATAVGGIIPLGNVISGNKFVGIHMTDNTDGFSTVNTFCGLKAFGGALPNGEDGMLIDGKAKNIKINTNVISGNKNNGLHIRGCANRILIGNNIIGMSTSGSSSLPNGTNGIKISENAHNINDGVSFPSVIKQNTISSNGEHGILVDGNANKIFFQYSVIGLAINSIDYFTNGKGGILIKDNVNNCEIGNSLNFLYVYDKNYYAIKLEKNTFNIIITYCFINTNAKNDPSIHNKNIINLSDKNYVYGNALPIEG